MIKKDRNFYVSLLLHIVVILAAFLVTNVQIHVIEPSRSDGMEVSLVAPTELNPTSKVVSLEKNVIHDQIQNNTADVNLKQQEDKNNAKNKLLQQKSNSIPVVPPIPTPHPVKSQTPSNVTKEKPSHSKQINDLVSELYSKNNAKNGMGNAIGGSSLGMSDKQIMVANYADLVIARVRQYVINPDELNSNAKAIIEVTLLPDMTVYNVRLIKTSGNPQYDSNIQQAIMRAAKFPPLPEGAKFTDYRKIRLIFRPE